MERNDKESVMSQVNDAVRLQVNGDETGWLVELKGQTPAWAIVTPDWDEHWTADASKALRFARKQDAEAYIEHVGWTEAFASEHMWCAP